MADLVQVGEGSMHGRVCRGGGGTTRLGGDLFIVVFAEVGEGPHAKGGSMRDRFCGGGEEATRLWGDLCMDDLVEVGEGSKHGYVC